MIKATHTYTLAMPFIAALVNDDYSGLGASEIEHLTRWLDGLPDGQLLAVPDGETTFARCDVTALMSDCGTMGLYSCVH